MDQTFAVLNTKCDHVLDSQTVPTTCAISHVRLPLISSKDILDASVLGKVDVQLIGSKHSLSHIAQFCVSLDSILDEMP